MEEAVQFTKELEKEDDKGVNRAVFSPRQGFFWPSNKDIKCKIG